MFIRITAWVLAVLCMALIFFMSSRSIEQSRSDSEWLMAMFGITDDGTGGAVNERGELLLSQIHIAIRKYAHLIIYGTLGILYFVSIYGYFGKTVATGGISTLLTAIYGGMDEIHQMFTGRGATVTDVFIDAAGGLIGVAVVGSMFLIAEKNKKIKTFFSRIYDFEPKRRITWKRST